MTLISLYPSFSQNLLSGKEMVNSFILKCIWFVKLSLFSLQRQLDSCINLSQKNEALIVRF